mmetsp:Transcript_22191/g.51039  ORF Transcript_22191/g.51039 Transcript_22191/m.51039 type:complete len:205 (+) Transcript_22191:569-1183(+)
MAKRRQSVAHSNCLAQPKPPSPRPLLALGFEGVLVRHDSHELLLVHLAVAVQIRLSDHLLQLLVCHVLTQLARYPLEIAEGDLTRLVIIEELEDTSDFLWRVSVAHLARHHFHKLLEIDRPRAVEINVGNHLAHFLLLRVKAKSTQRHLQLLCVNCAAPVRVEQVECLTQFLHLPFRDAWASEYRVLSGRLLRRGGDRRRPRRR